MQHTENYGLNKPDTFDFLSAGDLDENFDTLDTKVHDLSQSKIATSALQEALLNAMYPVGSIYITTQLVSPAAWIGGTWEPIVDTFLMCANSEYPAGTTGGSARKTIELSNLPTHHHVYTPEGIADEDGAHVHDNGQSHSFVISENTFTMAQTINRINYDSGHCRVEKADDTTPQRMSDRTGSVTTKANNIITVPNKDTTEAGEHDHEFIGDECTTAAVGGGEEVNIMPAYIAVSVWKRTA